MKEFMKAWLLFLQVCALLVACFFLGVGVMGLPIFIITNAMEGTFWSVLLLVPWSLLGGAAVYFFTRD